MARGDKADLFFRKLRSAGLSKPAVQTLAERLDALEAADSAASGVSDWPVWTAFTTTPFTIAPGSFTQQTLDHTGSDSSWADYIGAGTDFVNSPTFPARNGTLTFDAIGFTLTGPPAEALVEINVRLDANANPGDPATGGLALQLSTDYATENIWAPMSGAVTTAGVIWARRRILLGAGGAYISLLSTASVNLTVAGMGITVAVQPDPNL